MIGAASLVMNSQFPVVRMVSSFTPQLSSSLLVATPSRREICLQLTGQLVPRQPQRISDNLLMHIPFDLKHHPPRRYPRRPMIKTALSFPHPLVVPALVHAQPCAHSLVDDIVHAAHPLFDHIFADFELLGRDALVVRDQTQAKVAPLDRGAAGGAASIYLHAALVGFAAFGFEAGD